MISPQSLAIGAAAVGLVGKESQLFRFTLKHSFMLLLVICIITVIQAYVTPWVIPVYNAIETTAVSAISRVSEGFMYILGLAVILIILAATILFFNRKNVKVA
jgi:lactate permease